MAQESYQQVNLNSNVVWTWPFSFQEGPVVNDINDVATAQIQLPCYAATTTNLNAIYNNGTAGVGATLTNNGAFAIFAVDGVTPALNARILVKNQSILTNAHGIYTLTTVGDGVSIPWVLTRATDYDTPAEILAGDFISVTNGTTNANTNWVQTATIVSVGISSPAFISKLNGWTITLPNATLAQPGQIFRINNISSPPFQILLNDGTTLLTNVTSGQVFQLYLYSNATTNGLWRVIPSGGGTNAITSLTAQSSDGSITISGSPVSPTSGALNFKLPTSISNLNNVNTTGVPVVLSAAPLTWTTRTLLGGTNITVNNGSGVGANPLIDLNSALTSLGSVSLAGGLVLSGNIITTGVVNGGVQLNSNGTGVVSINGITFGTSGNVTGIATPRVYFTFTDTSPAHSINVLNSSNVTSIVWVANGTYTINFTTPLASTNYGLVFGLAGSGGIDPIHAYWITSTKTVNSVNIVVVGSSGTPVTDIPNGITGMIMLA